MKRLFTYFFLAILLTTVSGFDSLIIPSEFLSVKLENKEKEEKEESTEESSEGEIKLCESRVLESDLYFLESKVELGQDIKLHTEQYKVSAYHKLFVLYEQYLI